MTNMVTPMHHSMDQFAFEDIPMDSEGKKRRISARKVLSMRNIIITLIALFMVIIAFVVWIIGFTASNSSTRLLSERLKESSSERVVVMVESMFSQAQDLALSFKNFYDQQSDYMVNFFVNRTIYERPIKSMLFSSLVTRQLSMNSVNFVFKTGHIVGWECYKFDCNYIISNQIDDLTMMAYNYDFKHSYLKNTTVYQVPNFNAAAIIPTFRAVADPIYKNSTVRETGMFFPISRHVVFVDTYVTSIALPYYDSNDNLVGAANVVFYTDTLNSKVREANPSVEGYIIVIEDGGVIVAHSFVNQTAVMEKPCFLEGNTMVQSLCNYLFPPNVTSISSRFPTSTQKFGLDGFSIQRTETSFPGVKWHIFIAIPDKEIMGDIVVQSYNTIWISAIVLVLAIIVSVFTTFSLMRTLSQLAKCFDDIRNLDLDAPTILRATSGRTYVYELGELQNNFKSMIVTLKSIRKFVPVQIIKKILITGKEASLGIQDADATIFFLDIAGFTTLSEKMEPKALVDMICSVFETCSQSISSHQGVIDKFIGDAVMALWNVPTKTQDHEYHAIQAAIEIQTEMERKNIPTRIGIHSGRVKAGNIGSVDRFSFSVVGDGANLASRLEGANKAYASKIICSCNTMDVALISEERLLIHNPNMPRLTYRKLDKLKVKGKEKPVLTYQVFLSSHPKHTNDLDARDLKMYEKGFELLMKYQYKESLSIFYTLVDKSPKDLVLERKIDLCKSLIENGGLYEGKKFDGSIEITEK